MYNHGNEHEQEHDEDASRVQSRHSDVNSFVHTNTVRHEERKVRPEAATGSIRRPRRLCRLHTANWRAQTRGVDRT